MESNRWETAIRCLAAAVDPNARDDDVVAAVDAFRRAAGGVPLSQVCIEFACGGVPLTELAAIKDNLDRLRRENTELRRQLAIGEAAQEAAARRLDAAHRRIHQLTEEAALLARRDPTPDRPLGAFLAEARLEANEAASFAGNGSGRMARGDPAALTSSPGRGRSILPRMPA